MILLSIFGVVLFSLILIRSTDIFTHHLKELARKTSLGDFFLTSFLVGIATSLPEISVGVTSALEGVPAISLGNVMGSNVANLSIITGVATIISGTLFLRKKNTHITDFIYAYLAGIAPILLLIDGSLSRVDGLILLSLFGFYYYALLKKRDSILEKEENFIKTLLKNLQRNHTGRNFKYIFFSLTLIIFSSDVIVKSGVFIATSLAVPAFLIGLFLIAIGTSLPELAFGIRAIRRHEPELFLGNLLGSTVVNATFVIGLTALIQPIKLKSVSEYYTAIGIFSVIVLVFLLFIRSKHELNRGEGLVLIIFYLLFFLLEIFQHYA